MTAADPPRPFERVAVLFDLDLGPGAAPDLVRLLAPRAARVQVVARQPSSPLAWIVRRPGGELADAEQLESLRRALAAGGAEVALDLTLDPAGEAVAQAVAGLGAELLVVGPVGPDALEAVEVARRARLVPTLLGPAARPGAAGPLGEVLCPVRGRPAELAALGAFLRDRLGPAQRVTLLGLDALAAGDDLVALAQVAGVAASLALERAPGASLADAVALAAARGAGLLVLPAEPGMRALAAAAASPVPALLLPPPARPLERPWSALDAPDVALAGDAPRLRVEQAGLLPRPAPLPDQPLALVRGGRVVGWGAARGGELDLPPAALADGPGPLGLGRGAPGEREPLELVERWVDLFRPEGRPVVLLEAALPGEALRLAAQALAGRPEVTALAVRLRPTESFRAVRRRLLGAGLPRPRVLDAGCVLDEGAADDVPPEVDPVRLARVAARLRAGGFAVEAIVHRGRHPRCDGFTALHPEELQRSAGGAIPSPGGAGASPSGAHDGGAAQAHRPGRAAPPAAAGGARAARLDATTAARALPGHRVTLELDNRAARGHLLAAVRGARRRVCLQAYIAADDPVTRELEDALAAAAARGVEVRVLVDSLYSLHGSFGARNPWLARLEARRGIAVRASRPVAGLPSLEDMKQRDHRKLAVFDGAVATVGGRNLAREYYLGYDEVALGPASPWRDVPWLDAGVRLEGPAVAELERSFLQAWLEAGGEPFPPSPPPPPAGASPVRVVEHRGLQDARTLEAYLALIDTARSRLEVVNGFPLQLEVQRALLRAVRRGVRVRALFGHVRPVQGSGAPFGGPGSAIRELGTQLVHARMDALVAEGGEAYELVVQAAAGWDPTLREVRPHVHAKLVSADGEAFAVGSANLDITAGYWESEVLVVVEDPVAAAALDAELAPLFAAAARIDRDDPAWRRLASRRAWLSRVWPAVIG